MSTNKEKVALKRIVDDFSVLAVEACLIQKLPILFSPTNVIGFDDAAVTALAKEDDASAAERVVTQEKLNVLENGLRALKSVRQDTLSSQRGMGFMRRRKTKTEVSLLTLFRCP